MDKKRNQDLFAQSTAVVSHYTVLYYAGYRLKAPRSTYFNKLKSNKTRGLKHTRKTSWFQWQLTRKCRRSVSIFRVYRSRSHGKIQNAHKIWVGYLLVLCKTNKSNNTCCYELQPHNTRIYRFDARLIDWPHVVHHLSTFGSGFVGKLHHQQLRNMLQSIDCATSWNWFCVWTWTASPIHFLPLIRQRYIPQERAVHDGKPVDAKSMVTA